MLFQNMEPLQAFVKYWKIMAELLFASLVQNIFPTIPPKILTPIDLSNLKQLQKKFQEIQREQIN